MREILIVTTFKEFDDSRDAHIQEYWLRQLHNQTYKNFKLVVTNFREKNVKKVLEKSKLRYEFYQSTSDCLYSITEMIENVIKSIQPGKHIILWPSPDHMFDYNFFEVIAKNFKKESGGTSFPHPQYLSIQDYKDGKMYDEYFDHVNKSLFDYDPNKHIPETFYIDADLLLDKQWQKEWNQNRIVGTFPGIGLHLLLLTTAKKLINVVFMTKVHKIIGHVNPETGKLDKNFFGVSHKSNDLWAKHLNIIIKFCDAINVPRKYWKGTIFRSRKLVMFYRFRPIGSLKQRIIYYKYLFFFTIFPDKEFILKKKFNSLIKRII